MRRTLTYNQLYNEVTQTAAALKAMGVVAGDRVVGFVPNMPESIIAMLAATSLGAIWSSCSPDFGIKGVLDRFGQTRPKVLFTADGYFFKGKPLSSIERIAGIVAELPSIEKIVVVPYISDKPDISSLPNAVHYADFKDTSATEIDFVQMNFDDPLYIMYSSGTTGLPKCMVSKHRRGSASSEKGTCAPHGPEKRGYHLLFHHLRMDDVELADCQPVCRCHPGAV